MSCRKDINLENCTCSALGCSKRGKCCECVEYHRALGEIPGCFFNETGEKTYNRSINNFIEHYK